MNKLSRCSFSIAATALLISAVATTGASASEPSGPSFRGTVLSVAAPGAVSVKAKARANQLVVRTPVHVRWRVTNVGRVAGVPKCAIAIRVPKVSGIGLVILKVGRLRPKGSRTGESTVAPIGAFPPGLWAARVKRGDVTLGCKRG